jgi:hypothetical protein
MDRGERLRQGEEVAGDHETEPRKTRSRRNVAVGTTKKSVEIRTLFYCEENRTALRAR